MLCLHTQSLCFGVYKLKCFPLVCKLVGNKANGRIKYVSLSGGKKCQFFGKFGLLCFLVTSVLRFALLPYYRQTKTFLYTLSSILRLSRLPFIISTPLLSFDVEFISKVGLEHAFYSILNLLSFLKYQIFYGKGEKGNRNFKKTGSPKKL